MHFKRVLSTIGVGLAVAQATPIRDSIQEPISTDPASGTGSEEHQNQPTKYFHESSFSVNYDPRFASAALNSTAQSDAVKVLVQTYLSTFRDLSIQTWPAHGTLLGWWWNKQLLPWDAKPTVQVSNDDINFLAAYHNMTTWYFKYPKIPAGRSFQLEVNPNYVNGRQDDGANTVDARWIDMENGLFIDIMAVRYVKDDSEGEGVLASKDGHEFRNTYLYPLLETTFEGVKTKIPYKYKEMLVAEYGKDVLIRKNIKGHTFVDSDMKWIPNEEL
ncbi:mannosylphosphorylation protein [Colletotrichum truncatum]|uniref:Mannosylphosphorylation protein n=1 Tax=Colletotrichum truncatum TaxID=5467 RepID=A0ACC3YTF1_COLTU|nr:mannosylphosphorylation protein [Colletotrichum truncatum]KAF6798328.1 mannosylphosphorylation protein [Colletotrichum truncatum]